MVEPTRFGRRLKRLRERAGLSIAQLSARSGVPRTSLHGVENGTREGLSTESSARIARAMGISIDRLVGDAFDDVLDEEPRRAATIAYAALDRLRWQPSGNGRLGIQHLTRCHNRTIKWTSRHSWCQTTKTIPRP